MPANRTSPNPNPIQKVLTPRKLKNRESNKLSIRITPVTNRAIHQKNRRRRPPNSYKPNRTPKGSSRPTQKRNSALTNAI
jgi:hypothetical protein